MYFVFIDPYGMCCSDLLARSFRASMYTKINTQIVCGFVHILKCEIFLFSVLLLVVCLNPIPSNL